MYLGLDLGTSGLRGLLIDPDGQVLGDTEAPYPVRHLHPGWSEQDPQDWITAWVSTSSTEPQGGFSARIMRPNFTFWEDAALL